ncbi:MAG: thioredoxin domain-containing protein [bacterium]|nr:thioredoxin domain-containing protein [bacterium]
MQDAKSIFKTWWGVLMIIFLAIILILLVAVGFYFANLVKTSKQELKNNSGVKLTGRQYPAEDNQHYWLGAAKPKITIVEFGDFSCPNSEKSFPTIREIGLKYKGDIKFIWRDYPVVQDYSALLALAGRCAGEQGLFWPMHDKLFQNQGVNTANQLSALAAQIGADTAKFNDCLAKQKYQPQIQKDFSDGQSFGNQGTPTWFINGYKVDGDIPYDIFIKIIEELKK